MTTPHFLTSDPEMTHVTFDVISSAVDGMLIVEEESEIAMVVSPSLREPDHWVDTSLISTWEIIQHHWTQR